MTDYGLAPISSNPTFTIATTPGVFGTPRWLAPEIIQTPKEGRCGALVGSKPADVFAFAMLAIEVFTGKVPFWGQKNKTVAIRIAQGGRPNMPGNAWLVGLTSEMWKFLKICWHQNPKKQPTMDMVVRRWEKLVGHGSGGEVTECMQIADTSDLIFGSILNFL